MCFTAVDRASSLLPSCWFFNLKNLLNASQLRGLAAKAPISSALIINSDSHIQFINKLVLMMREMRVLVPYMEFDAK